MTAHAAPAAAAEKLGVGNPGQSSFYTLVSAGSFVNLSVFSGSGPAVGPDLVADLSGLESGVSVTADGSGCFDVNEIIYCDKIDRLRIGAGASAGPGPAGRITLRNRESSATIPVDVLTSAGATLASSDVTVSGAVGDVVTVPISVRNQGPNTIPVGGIASFYFERNTQLVSIDGCAPGPQRCIREKFLAGTSIDVTLKLRITACGTPNASGVLSLRGVTDTKFAPGQFKVNVTGCGGGGDGQGAKPAATAVPTSTPSAEPSATSSAPLSASPSSASSSALAQPDMAPASARKGFLAWALILLVIALVIAGVAYGTRKFWAPGRSAEPPTPSL